LESHIRAEAPIDTIRRQQLIQLFSIEFCSLGLSFDLIH